MTGRRGDLSELAIAFRRIAGDHPRFRVETPGVAGHPTDPDEEDAIIEAKAHTADRRAHVVMRLDARGARLTARCDPQPGGGGIGFVEDHLAVRLDAGFRWGTHRFADASGLATALTDHMLRRLDLVSQRALSPRIGSGGSAEAAEHKDGVIRIQVPKLEKARGRRIEVAET